jgi:hypothetical protein
MIRIGYRREAACENWQNEIIRRATEWKRILPKSDLRPVLL